MPLPAASGRIGERAFHRNEQWLRIIYGHMTEATPMHHTHILGRSIADPVVASYLAEHERLDPADFRHNAELGFFGGPNSGFGLHAEPLQAYLAQYEQLRSRALPDDQEMIVVQLFFTGPDAVNQAQRAYAAALPFGLAFGDDADVVSQKLGAAPFRQDKSATLPEYSAERSVYSYSIDGLQVIAKYDGGHRLMAVYLLQADRTALAAKRRRGSLGKHAIVPGNAERLEAFRARIPTPRWREALAEGDRTFNEPDIATAEALLNAFIDAAKDATGNASAPAIHVAVEELVLGLNEINARSGMIETLERDELGTLIDEIVRATGFSLDDGEDITSEWRAW
ncbi:hypothetical protein JR065_16530 [Xanthomonas sp. AmX2]|uniref:hypothetical protein n=1 Tax=Xanthomonas sp. TaxID=29446 RepID=UPI00197F37BB|nr:hypothetical protein [Xanthomonas sp.]MBN6151952.1 hypothetical protein [Xanthomonas sp.]